MTKIIDKRKKIEPTTFKELQLGDVFECQGGYTCIKTSNADRFNSLAFDDITQTYMEHYEPASAPVILISATLILRS